VTPRYPIVLIVDDNALNRKLACDVLRHAGFEPLEAGSAAEGIAAAARHQPDVILMDLRLPDLDGASAVAVLRAEPRSSGIPVVAMTALPLADGDGWLIDAGFAGSITKPIDVGALPDMVRRFAARNTE